MDKSRKGWPESGKGDTLGPRVKWGSVGDDVVVLHMLGRGWFSPNVSPSIMKIETYLRMANIPYQIDCEVPVSPGGEAPWITLNGEDVVGARVIMHTLVNKYGKTMDKNLTLEQRVKAHTIMVMMNENFYWVLQYWRYIVTQGGAIHTAMPLSSCTKVYLWAHTRMMAQRVVQQGTGTLQHTQVVHMARHDLEALSVYLGDNRYLLGDVATEVDCVVFGMLSQIMWNSPKSPYHTMIHDEFPNLQKYCHRMKETFWPDWDACLSTQ